MLHVRLDMLKTEGGNSEAGVSVSNVMFVS